jgi:hypothetical protein
MKCLRLAVLLLTVLPLIISCGPRKSQGKNDILSSDSIIPEKKFVSLLTDVHLLEAGLMTQRNKGQQDRKWAEAAYRSLFIRYHVTKSQFTRNLEYYQKDTRSFNRIYDTVISHINRQKSKEKEKK